MHDIEQNPKKRMPPLIVLGLTGPVGSGCTTVGKLFSTRTSFDLVLKYLKWINLKENGGFDINWDGVNEEIDKKYEKLTILKELLKKYNLNKNEMDSNEFKKWIENVRKKLPLEFGETIDYSFNLEKQLEELEERLRKILTKNLEIREEIKALEKLKDYHSEKKHLFYTLSVSDLIVFRALMEIEKDNFNLTDVEETEGRNSYKNFISIAQKHINRKREQEKIEQSGCKGYADYHKKCYRYKSKSELEKLGKYFEKINKITIYIKNEFNKKYPYEYSGVMQDLGDNIRKCGDPFGRKKYPIGDTSYRLAKGIAQRIYLLYKTRRAAFFIIDCLRNPYEVIYLRREFANFYLLSLYAEKSTREERIANRSESLLKSEFNKKEIIRVFREAYLRDSGKFIKGDEVLYKQNVTKCVEISDISIINEKKWKRLESKEDANIFLNFCRKPFRILCLILSPGCTKPNDDEMRMNIAYTMAVESNCISRQVGAVIVSTDGYIVGAGWNDVGEGKISCGLRSIRDLKIDEFKPLLEAIIRNEDKNSNDVMEKLISIYKNDFCKHIEQFCFCFKDEMVTKDVTQRLVKAWHNKVDDFAEELKTEKREELNISRKYWEEGMNKVKETGEQFLKELIEKGNLHQLEYCLALHAEENAIIQSSKIGGMGLKGGTIYTTAQPCSLCAKKIQQIGLKKVIYTEAYPASLSEVYMKGVDLEQFEGVKPRAYIRLFMPHHDQKEWQYLESQNLVPVI